ncbi:MAG: aminopeptidase [Chloroflexota bacterium]
MSDPRSKKQADILVNYSTEVRPGEWVVILAEDLVAEPLVNDIAEKVLQAGGYPTAYFTSERILETALRTGSEEQLSWPVPLRRFIASQANVLITVWAARNTRFKGGVAGSKVRAERAGQREFLEAYSQRVASGELRWAGTQFPCDAFALEADMNLHDYEDFAYSAMHADQEDPVSHWRQVHSGQQRLVDWLKGKKEVVVHSPSAELRLSIAGRTFINGDGKKNMPCGEIFTSPVEDSVNGWVEFSFPAVYLGREVEGVRLEFEDGKVTQATARKNEDYLHQMLDSDDNARYLGEFAFGTNTSIQRFTKSILFDEKIGGTIHLAVGRGFAEAGGKNFSTLHWDMICDMRQQSEVLVDGELFYKDGKFQV